MLTETSTLEPGAAGLLVVAGAAWGFAAGASRPQGANAAVSALASPLLAPLLLPPAAMLASLIGIFDDGARPIPFGLAVAACLVAGGAMSALALASASLGALAFGGGAYLALRLVLGSGSDHGFVQPAAALAGAAGLWASLGFGAHRLMPGWLAATLGPVAVTQTVVTASRIVGGPATSPNAGAQMIAAGGGAAVVAAVYVLREAARRRSRRLRRNTARAAQ